MCLPPRTPTAPTLAELPRASTEVVGAAAAAARTAQGATMQLEERNAQLEAQVQQLQGALGAMLLGELAAELGELVTLTLTLALSLSLSLTLA